MRKNNIAEMSIAEQVEAIKQSLCDDYCKMPQEYHEKYLHDEYKDEEEARAAMECEECANCPLLRL